MQANAKFEFFRCLNCGYSGAITEAEIAKHRSRCATGTREAVSQPSPVERRQEWECFHCGEKFTTVGAAEDHFGKRPEDTAACKIKVGEERGLVMSLRKAHKDREELWQILDDIDTLSDAAKGDDAGYRKAVEKFHKRRFAIAESPDGHKLIWKRDSLWAEHAPLIANEPPVSPQDDSVSQPSEPAGLVDSAPGELVSRMLDAYYAEDGETRPSKWEGSAVISMTNALAVARADWAREHDDAQIRYVGLKSEYDALLEMIGAPTNYPGSDWQRTLVDEVKR